MSVFPGPQIDLTPEEVHRRMTAGELVLVDVREPYEYEAGHVPESVHIELERLASAAAQIPDDRPVAFLCLSGARSAMATNAFRRAGYEAYNVGGGFAAWFDADLPVEPEDGEVAPH